MPLRIDFDQVETALSDLAGQIENAVEDLRSALAHIENDDARSAIDVATDEIDLELTYAVRTACRDILAACDE